MTYLEFKEKQFGFESKQFDGPFEVSGIEIKNEGEIFRGVLYFPPTSFKKPYPLIIYFHGFPQLLTLPEIVKNHEYLLNKYAFIAFNFRGYNISEGTVSIRNQVLDAQKMIDFVNEMAKHKILDLNNINIIGNDFGAYIGLLICSNIKRINKLLLVSPILDLKKKVYSEDFKKVLHYINRFLPGNIQGIENIEEFIEMTKKELSKKEFQIEKAIQKLKINGFKIIIGNRDKITPLSEVNEITKCANINPEIIVIENMDHECAEDEELEEVSEEIKKFFKY